MDYAQFNFVLVFCSHHGMRFANDHTAHSIQWERAAESTVQRLDHCKCALRTGNLFFFKYFCNQNIYFGKIISLFDQSKQNSRQIGREHNAARMSAQGQRRIAIHCADCGAEWPVCHQNDHARFVGLIGMPKHEYSEIVTKCQKRFVHAVFQFQASFKTHFG